MDELLESDTQQSENKKQNKNKNSKNRKIPKKKINRGGKKKKESLLCMMSTNAAQLKGKLNSFKCELKRANAALFTVQETHYATKGKVQVENFEVFEAIRKKAKGGTMIGAHKALKPFLIQEYSNEFELLVVEIKIANKEIRIVSGYGPQENWPETERMPFFLALEEEIIKAQLAGKSIIIELDANSKLGPQMIPGDMHCQSENGKILAGIIERNGLVLGNSLDQCEGVVTRKRITKNNIEESAIDFVLISFDLKSAVESIKIDEEREHVLTKIMKTKNGVVKVESDHNTIISKFKLHWNKKAKENRIEMFNLKNKVCQEKFKEETTGTNNNKFLSSVFDGDEDINIVTEKFLKRLQKTISKCFRKVRVTEKTDQEKDELFLKWKDLKKNTDNTNKEELEKVENELADKYAEEYFEKIKEKTEGIDCEDGGLSSGSLWNFKKDIFPKCTDPPTAMKDPLSGNLLTTDEKIQEAAVNVYKKRLENRPIKDDLKHIKDAKEMLCDKLLKLAGSQKTPPWKLKDLEKVLKYLKKQKSRDPLGLANEIFRPEVAGDDLKLAVLKLMNRIKDDQKYPECLELCNISSIWKKKGSRNDFDCYRGIFRVTIFRSILDRLIYNDEYNNIDGNLTDCNVGARKKRNIRDNIFVINAIMNSVKKKNEEALDFQVYDIEKCFDALWLHEVINCLYEAGLRNDKLPLLFLENNNAQVAIKSNGGLSQRVSIKNIIMQGSVWGSICCVVLMDKLGKLAYSNPDLLYYYKGVVGTPPLQMVDDIMGIQKCSSKSLQLNTAINTFIELEKLTLSRNKSHNVHIGKQSKECPLLKVHENIMEQSSKETYLGDVIDKSGNVKPNIEGRKAKGYGIISNILAIVNEVPLGHWKIEAGLRLRQAMLVNGILFNSEAWHGISQKDIAPLEKVDEALLRGLLKAHSKIPIEALYLETGAIPIRFIVASRRIMYLQSILQKDKNEIVRKVFEAQKVDTSPGDYFELVTEDKINMGLELSDTELENMNKEKLKNIVKSKTRQAALKYLKTVQASHSKMSCLNYNSLELSPYMFSSESAQLLLALRTRTVKGIKKDFEGLYSDILCPLKCGKDDKLENVLTCPVLLSNHTSDNLSSSDIRHEDIFSSDIVKQKQATELYRQLLEVRTNLMNTQPVDRTGPVHRT